MSRKLMFACAALSLVAAAPAAHAADKSNDAVPVVAARVTLSDAVTAAEQKVQGKAVRAEYEAQKGGGWVYDVEVVAGSKVFDVKVDGDKGTVIAATEDEKDADDGDDKAD